MNKIGFGFLRLPQTGSKGIDWPLLEAMVDAFLAGGGTYFDTAYTYLDGMSEAALKRAVAERHPRASFQIADKLPGWKVMRREDCERYFQEQCERCGVDFFDVYLLHWPIRTWMWCSCKSTIWIGTIRQWRPINAMTLQPASAKKS